MFLKVKNTTTVYDKTMQLIKLLYQLALNSVGSRELRSTILVVLLIYKALFYNKVE
jgi:hypothetical protein